MMQKHIQNSKSMSLTCIVVEYFFQQLVFDSFFLKGLLFNFLKKFDRESIWFFTKFRSIRKRFSKACKVATPWTNQKIHLA